MNSWRILQKICPFILLVFQGVHSENKAPFTKCNSSPLGLPKVKATVYLNGENIRNGDANSDYYTLVNMSNPLFSMDVLTIIFKIGARVTCDAKDKCSCKGSEREATDCKDAFKTACVSKLMDQSTLFVILSCQTDTAKTLDDCIKEAGVNLTDLQICIDNKIGQETAIANANEMAKFLPEANSSEPYILFGDSPVYDACMSTTATHYFSKTVCAMLDSKAAATSPCT